MKTLHLIMLSVLMALVSCSKNDEPEIIRSTDIVEGPLNKAEFAHYVEGTTWRTAERRDELVLPDGSVTEPPEWVGWDSNFTYAFRCDGEKWTRYYVLPPLYVKNFDSYPSVQRNYQMSYSPASGEIVLTEGDEEQVWYEIDFVEDGLLALKYTIGNSFADGKGYIRTYFRPATPAEIEEMEEYANYDDLTLIMR